MRNKQTKVLIVDDQPDVQAVLKAMLVERKDLSIVGVASSCKEAYEIITNRNPDLVLLDIEMPGESGLDLFNYFDKPPFRTIVVTAHSDYTISALKLSAMDYLLKPITADELNESIDRAFNIIEEEESQYEVLKQYLAMKPKIDRLIIPSDTDKKSLLFEEILYLKSDGGYTVFHTANQGHLITSKPIKYYEKVLPQNFFFRTHKSYIINFTHIKGLPAGRSGYIELNNGSEVQLSVRRAPDFRAWYKGLTLGGQ